MESPWEDVIQCQCHQHWVVVCAVLVVVIQCVAAPAMIQCLAEEHRQDLAMGLVDSGEFLLLLFFEFRAIPN